VDPDFSAYPRLGDPRFTSLRPFVGAKQPYAEAFGKNAWLEDEAKEGLDVICDEELLDDGGDEPGER
jgi:hypothetical protein